jgi:MFS family permease
LHGFAGVFWNPPSQVLLYDIVGADKLHSAVRLSATGRWLGLLLGPGVGAGILLLFGAKLGIALNALIYLPMMIWLWRAPYGPKFRSEKSVPPRAVRSFADVRRVLKEIARNRTIVAMSLLAGGASLFVGNAYHPQMPGFAQDLGHGHADMTYSFLLAADAAGALAAGILFESRNWLKSNERNAILLAMGWCVAMAGFAMTRSYWAALLLLFAAGFLELSFNAMAQTLVQISAPVHLRGAVVGLFHMFALGFRAFSGISVGLMGSLIGIHWSLALSAMALFAASMGLFGFITRAAPLRRD